VAWPSPLPVVARDDAVLEPSVDDCVLDVDELLLVSAESADETVLWVAAPFWPAATITPEAASDVATAPPTRATRSRPTLRVRRARSLRSGCWFSWSMASVLLVIVLSGPTAVGLGCSVARTGEPAAVRRRLVELLVLAGLLLFLAEVVGTALVVGPITGLAAGPALLRGVGRSAGLRGDTDRDRGAERADGAGGDHPASRPRRTPDLLLER
jgi:hypothetical protein